MNWKEIYSNILFFSFKADTKRFVILLPQTRGVISCISKNSKNRPCSCRRFLHGQWGAIIFLYSSPNTWAKIRTLENVHQLGWHIRWLLRIEKKGGGGRLARLHESIFPPTLSNFRYLDSFRINDSNVFDYNLVLFINHQSSSKSNLITNPYQKHISKPEPWKLISLDSS